MQQREIVWLGEKGYRWRASLSNKGKDLYCGSDGVEWGNIEPTAHVLQNIQSILFIYILSSKHHNRYFP